MVDLAPGHYFVTGTDTDCGKTFVTLQLMQRLKHLGYTVLGIKPIAAGAHETPNGLRNDDALLLQSASDFSPDYARVNPVCFRIAASPHIAAAAEGITVDAHTLAQHLKRYDVSRYDYVFFEGAGGVHAPISHTETVCDLIQCLGVPAILVVGMKLGCLNHALLSATALKNKGIPVVAWVANEIDTDMDYVQDNIVYLNAQLGLSNLLIYL